MKNSAKWGYTASGRYIEDQDGAYYDDGQSRFSVRKAHRTPLRPWTYTGNRPPWDYPVVIEDGQQ